MDTSESPLSLRMGMMALGIFLIGVCVGSFRLSAFGVDAFTCMNLGISGFVGLSFGTWQLMVNAVLLVIIFFRKRSCIGPGTIVNMVGVGYMADFICWMVQDVAKLEMTLPLRLVALALGMVLAGLGVAFYMVADLGIAPYDAVGVLIEEGTGGALHYDRARVISDVTAVLIGVVFCLLAGGELGLIIGVGTLLNALLNGPLIQFFKDHVAAPLFHKLS